MSTEKLEIGICDDSIEDLKKIQSVFHQCMLEFGENNFFLHVYSSGKSMCEDSKNRTFDLVFIDWEMPEVDGFDLAQRLYMENSEIKLAFVSNHENMVFEAYEYTPFWFVRKRCIEKDMRKAMQKYFDMTAAAQIHYKIEGGFGSRYVRLDKVMYVESNKHTLMIRMSDQTSFMVYKSLQSLQQEWIKYGFIRTHKSYLVNCKYIKEVGIRTIRRLDGTELDMSKNRRREIVELVNRQKKGG